MNIVLALGLLASGTYLLMQDAWFLADRWDHTQGTLFQGTALRCLALGLIFLGSFSAMVARAWIRGVLPLPLAGTLNPDLEYRGAILVRYWYLALPSLGLIVLAFLLADKAPHPATSAPQSGMPTRMAPESDE